MSSSCSEQARQVAFSIFNLTIYSDGSVDRAPLDPPVVAACPTPASPDAVATKDVTINDGKGIWARLYLPPPDKTTAEINGKLPILLYFHGGGFISFSTARPADHNFLEKLCGASKSLIVSVDYRLAPEHPLPAAYEDCYEALLWLNTQARKLALSNDTVSVDPWLASHGDFSSVTLGGDSAGGNIVHHVAIKAVSGLGFGDDDVESWQPLDAVRLKAMILIHPFFTCGAPETLDIVVKVWDYSGPGPDHVFSNPLKEPAIIAGAANLPPALVAVASADFLHGRGVAYHRGLVAAGRSSTLFVSENEGHVFHLESPASPNVGPFVDQLCRFINGRHPL